MQILSDTVALWDGHHLEFISSGEWISYRLLKGECLLDHTVQFQTYERLERPVCLSKDVFQLVFTLRSIQTESAPKEVAVFWQNLFAQSPEIQFDKGEWLVPTKMRK